MKRFKIWPIVLLCTTLVGLSGEMALSEGPVLPGYALGDYDPHTQSGRVTYLEAAPTEALSSLPASTYAEEVVRLINLERRKVGLAPYKVNPVLTAIAEGHSAYMRDHGCFAHQCPGEVGPAERACAAGYGPYCWGACFIGETIGAGFATPASLVAAWMASPGHRSILLDGELREIGVGYVTGGYYGTYWTADFGSQPDVLPVFINYDDAETDTQSVTVTLTNENVSGCSGIDYAGEVMLSNDPGFAGAVWEAYALHKPWTLTAGNGPKTVYVRYRDSTGYQVTSSDDILLRVPYDLQLSAHALTFLYRVGSGFVGPSGAPVEVNNGAGQAAMEWSAECHSRGTWPECNPTGGVTPAELSVSVTGFQTESEGTYTATITVTSPQDPDNPERVTVTIRAVEQVYQVFLPAITR